MTPKEAIEILETAPILHVDDIYPRERTALAMGIEALKLNLEMREAYAHKLCLTLPGETEE